MPKYLTADQLLQYRENGVVFPVRALSACQTEFYRRQCDALEQALGGRPRTIELRQMHLHFRWAFELATCTPVLDAAEDLLGADLLIWATELFSKHPHDAGVSIGWHRDSPYMGFDPPHAVTAWISLGASTPANGCMRFVPEPGPEGGITDDCPQQAFNEAGAPAANPVAQPRDPIDVVLAPGEMSLHNSFVLHGSRCNSSDAKRVGFAVRFVAPTARPRHGRPPAILARGGDRWGHFQLVEGPQGADLDQAISRMRESAARHLEAMLQNTKSERRSTAGRSASRPPGEPAIRSQ